MLLKLHGRQLRALGPTSSDTPFVARVSESVDRPDDERAKEILLVRSAPVPTAAGFRAVLSCSPTERPERQDVFFLGEEMRYLAHGDVVRIDPRRGAISVLYRRSSPSNSLLVTERCDNFCLMCSQPPKKADDSWLVDELHRVIPLLSPETREIGITGGEPGLLGERLIGLVELLHRHVPQTAVHVLSNGRAFANPDFARAVGAIRHPDLMLGIPLYSDIAEEHDFVVQARGAFSETIRGILELKRARVRVEIRFVIHAETYRRLPEFAAFVARNLLFVDHVALMGLELMGFAKTNLDRLWVDPVDYQSQLAEAARTLTRAGVNLSLYNHQLCVLRPELHPLARRSISDWKNAYHAECEGCGMKESCGGFFASAEHRRSRGIRAMNSEGGTVRV